MDFDRAVIMHGKPKEARYGDPRFSPARANWIGWTAEELARRGVKTITPKIEDAWRPDVAPWHLKMTEIEPFIMGWASVRSSGGYRVATNMYESCALIGHSAAAGPILKLLSGTVLMRRPDGEAVFGAQRSVKGLVLVAPWLDPEDKYGFGNFDIDPELADRVGTIRIVHCNQDLKGGVPESIERIMDVLNLGDECLIGRDGYGHFMTGNAMPADHEIGNGLMGSTFPELIKILEQV